MANELAMSNMKNVVLKKKIAGVLCDLAPRTDAANVRYDDDSSVYGVLSALITKVGANSVYKFEAGAKTAVVSDIVTEVEALQTLIYTAGTAEVIDTLKDVLEYVNAHKTEFEALQAETRLAATEDALFGTYDATMNEGAGGRKDDGVVAHLTTAEFDIDTLEGYVGVPYRAADPGNNVEEQAATGLFAAVKAINDADASVTVTDSLSAEDAAEGTLYIVYSA